MIFYESALALEDLDNLSLCLCKVEDGKNVIRKLKISDITGRYATDFILGGRIVIIDNPIIDNPEVFGDTEIVKVGEYCRIAEVKIVPNIIY